MKVFMTGTSLLNVYPHRTRMRLWELTDAIEWGLKELGHTVVREAYHPEHDLRQYGFVLIVISHPSCIISTYAPNMLLCLARAKRFGIPRTVLVGDWNWPRFRGWFAKLGVKQITGRLKFLMRGQPRGRKKYGWGIILNHLIPELLPAAEEMAHGPWPNPIIAGWSWTPRGPLKEAIGPYTGDLTILDPSSLHPWWPEATASAAKLRSWIIGAIYDPRKWVASLNLTWPVRWVLGRRMKQKAIRHEELIQLYTEYWGVLCHQTPYGYLQLYRDKIVNTVRAGSIILMGREESKGLGPAYELSPSDVEGLSSTALQGLAAYQAKTFWNRSWNVDQFLDHLESLVTRLTEGGVA